MSWASRRRGPWTLIAAQLGAIKGVPSGGNYTVVFKTADGTEQKKICQAGADQPCVPDGPAGAGRLNRFHPAADGGVI